MTAEKTIDDVYRAVYTFACAAMAGMLGLVNVVLVYIEGVPAVLMGGLVVATVIFMSLGKAWDVDGYNRQLWSRLGADVDFDAGGESA